MHNMCKRQKWITVSSEYWAGWQSWDQEITGNVAGTKQYHRLLVMFCTVQSVSVDVKQCICAVVPLTVLACLNKTIRSSKSADQFSDFSSEFQSALQVSDRPRCLMDYLGFLSFLFCGTTISLLVHCLQLLSSENALCEFAVTVSLLQISGFTAAVWPVPNQPYS